MGPSPGEAGSNLLKSDSRRHLTKRSSLHKKRSSLRGRTKVAKVGPLRARVKSAKVRPTPYVYFPRVLQIGRCRDCLGALIALPSAPAFAFVFVLIKDKTDQTWTKLASTN